MLIYHIICHYKYNKTRPICSTNMHRAIKIFSFISNKKELYTYMQQLNFFSRKKLMAVK